MGLTIGGTSEILEGWVQNCGTERDTSNVQPPSWKVTSSKVAKSGDSSLGNLRLLSIF